MFIPPAPATSRPVAAAAAKAAPEDFAAALAAELDVEDGASEEAEGRAVLDALLAARPQAAVAALSALAGDDDAVAEALAEAGLRGSRDEAGEVLAERAVDMAAAVAEALEEVVEGSDGDEVVAVQEDAAEDEDEEEVDGDAASAEDPSADEERPAERVVEEGGPRQTDEDGDAAEAEAADDGAESPAPRRGAEVAAGRGGAVDETEGDGGELEDVARRSAVDDGDGGDGALVEDDEGEADGVARRGALDDGDGDGDPADDGAVADDADAVRAAGREAGGLGADEGDVGGEDGEEPREPRRDVAAAPPRGDAGRRASAEREAVVRGGSDEPRVEGLRAERGLLTAEPRGAEAPRPSGAPRGEPSALVQRITEAVERMEQSTPPRRMTVDLGELRVSVTLRSDATVRVAALNGGGQALEAWRAELSEALAERGLDLADDRPSQQRRDDDRPGGFARPEPRRAASGSGRAASDRRGAGLRL